MRALADGSLAPPRVYFDANVPAGVCALARRTFGWDALHVVEHAVLRRASDRFHFVHALELGRTLVTLDLDFADESRFPPDIGPGIIVLSAADERLLGRLLRHADRTLLRGASSNALPLRGRTVVLTIDVLTPSSTGRRRC